ncbi:hypothetical protein [Brevundimonas sp. NIBR11]|uniref:hypothetical protein n=1 Tax=Brevundimonas sp. NIBR11 TaxID=3015999 RepID=UPI0022F01D20|nr:hypothetical protein [Brevundimonas sp. NIBR11]WGM30609.1 hypothetical protein KKHFBJBL_00834 [Brevundimonas sp. NIBR11]
MIDGSPEDVAAGRVVSRVTEDQRQALTRLDSVNAKDTARLETIANSYYRDFAQEDAGKASKGEQNGSIAIMLDWVGKARSDPTDRARGTLEELYLASDDDLAFRLLHAIGLRKPDSIDLSVSEMSLDLIEYALMQCRTDSRGPLPASPAERRLIAELVDAWETGTGLKATHNPKLRTEYTGHAHSAAGRFVSAAVQIIAPAIRQTSVASLMEQHLKGRRLAARERKAA